MTQFWLLRFLKGFKNLCCTWFLKKRSVETAVLNIYFSFKILTVWSHDLHPCFNLKLVFMIEVSVTEIMCNLFVMYQLFWIDDDGSITYILKYNVFKWCFRVISWEFSAFFLLFFQHLYRYLLFVSMARHHRMLCL